MATIKDVARKAGVSPSTVSHAFSGKRKISEPVRQRIFRISRELDYRPNLAAQSLKTKQTKNLGLCIASEAQMNGTFFYELLKGLSGASASEDYRVLLLTRQENITEREYYMSLRSDMFIDGVVLTDPNVHDTYMLKLVEREIPLVVVGRPAGEQAKFYVDNDNVELAR